MRDREIGNGTWIDKLAHEMMEREKDLNRDIKNTIWVESGLGASGIPHIGSIGDAVRAYGVKLALNDMGYKSELLAYADDMDGLRKIPAGLDKNQTEMLKDEIGKPVSFIPDPFGKYESYGYHMGKILRDGLDRLGMDYMFRRAYNTYSAGMLRNQTHEILSVADSIGDIIMDITGQEKYKTTLPYFAICHNCGKIYTTNSYHYDPKTRHVLYECGDSVIGGTPIKGCGHSGQSRISRNEGKLSWKVEFAARWSRFDIRFEAYGKDIMDSVLVNDKIASDILHTPPPHHARYEMFLDSGGKKI